MRLAGAVEPHHGAPANVNVTASAAVAVAVVADGSSLGARTWCRDKRCQCQSPVAATTIPTTKTTTTTTTTRTTRTTTITTLPTYDAVIANGAATAAAADVADEDDVNAGCLEAGLSRVVSFACHTATDVLYEGNNNNNYNNNNSNNQSNRINNKKTKKTEKTNCTHRKWASKVEQGSEQRESAQDQEPLEKHEEAEVDADANVDVNAKDEDVEAEDGVKPETQPKRNITTQQKHCENTTSNAINKIGVQQLSNNNKNNNNNNNNQSSFVNINYNNDRVVHSAAYQYNNNSDNFNEINEISKRHLNNVKQTSATTTTPTPTIVSRQKRDRNNNFKASNMAAGNVAFNCNNGRDSAHDTSSNNNNNNNNNKNSQQRGNRLPSPLPLPASLRCCAALLALLVASVVEMCAVGWLRVRQSLMSCGSNETNNNNNNNKVLRNGVALWPRSRSPSLKCSPRSPFAAAAAVALAFIRGSTPTTAAHRTSVSRHRCRRSMSAATATALCLLYAVLSLPAAVHGDDSDTFFAVNSFSMAPETVTPEFDYASRGQKKFGDKCDNTLECGFPGSICDPKKKSCQCTEDLPVTNHIDKCGKEAAVNESCFFNEQCEMKYFQTECRDGRCVCRFDMTPIWGKDGTVECKGRQDKRGPETYIDPAMIGVLVGMALMFIIICVVLRLFSQARWRENRTIFNTPNPRLMNVSLLRDSKLLHGQERRGSRMSVRAPSRQPSMASLRPHSPNPSLGKTGSRSGSNSANGSNASATSVRSTRSNSVAPGNVVSNSHHERKASQHQQHHHQSPPPPPPPQHQTQHHHQHQHQHQQQMPLITNITANPVAESVTVEIIEPEK